MNFNHPLMENNITRNDLKKVISFLKQDNIILTQSFKVKKFEEEWSKWLGCKYSVFVNSGSSANLLSISALKILGYEGEIIVPPLTWVSDITAVLHCGFKPVFVDINPKTLCMNEDQIIKKINKKTVAVFITYVQGFNGLSQKLLSFLKKKNILLIEDVCESHGATFGKKKLGTYGLMSNFSFYYAHHMSTIEGGMISTNSKKISEILRSLRSHGMARELGNKILEKKIVNKNKMLSPKFIFLYSGYNMRSNEISAVIGLNQLRNLDNNNKKRQKNLNLFLSLIDKDKYQVEFDVKGNSNYAFPVIFKKPSFDNRKRFENTLAKYNIEFRRGNAGGGNQLRQPYLKNIIKKTNFKNFPYVEHVHFFGYYIGNYPSLSLIKIKKICNILNSIDFN
jgi:CDP-6-deoxy-D-xylo-4-hexulose-3-dehydrase